MRNPDSMPPGWRHSLPLLLWVLVTDSSQLSPLLEISFDWRGHHPLSLCLLLEKSSDICWCGCKWPGSSTKLNKAEGLVHLQSSPSHKLRYFCNCSFTLPDSVTSLPQSHWPWISLVNLLNRNLHLKSCFKRNQTCGY